MASQQSQQSLHLHYETSDNETSTYNSTDLNDTWDYVEQSPMDIGNTGTSKRSLSDSENSDFNDKISSKKHVSGSTKIVFHDFQNQNAVVFAESRDVNLGKTNPIFIAKTINDLVGHVNKVINTQNGLKILCRKSQANILSKENKFGMYSCTFSVQNAPKQKIKGIAHGIPLDMNLAEIKKELEKNNAVKIEQIKRLQKFDKIKKEKIDTESIILDYGQEIEFPKYMYLGYRRITVKQFIPYPVRCFKCQKFGHVKENCRAKVKCPICSEEHTFENCDKKDMKKCCNCGQNHSAGYKGCEEFLKAKKIREYSFSQKISYAEATKQIRTATDTSNIINQEENVQQKSNNEDQIVTKVFEKVQSHTKKNEEAIIEKVVDQLQTQSKNDEKQFIDQIFEQFQSKTSDYEEIITDKITEKIKSNTKCTCKCRITPEAIFVFIIRAMKYFKDDSFLKKSSDSQIRHLAHLFKVCTLIMLNQDKVYEILRS